ncbi:hypothetical protein J2741_001257 [Methanolinea mesophila]|uniref:DUF7289 family protein n=1 Tax=Methanolinea mesophila TaxID=547055 RepID=UPI001AEB9FBD|nr:hypothetical protein [Methanolinea mesophila]MBP1928710.1 hypothetical protein [Methanolinea mesophila]
MKSTPHREGKQYLAGALSRRDDGREAGVSETVGYILIFGIMMAGIALVTLYGYPLLLNQQANSNIQNMERNMISLQTDVNSLTYKNVPYKESTVQVSGGTLSVSIPDSNTPFFRIVPENGAPVAFQPGNIHYLDDSQGAYVELLNGAVVQRYNGQVGSVMISDPRWYYDPGQNILVVTWIGITADAAYSVTGISTVQMAITDPPLEYTFDNPGTVDISYGQDPAYHNSDDIYREAWSNYLTGGKFGMTKTPNVFWDNYTFSPATPLSQMVVKIYTVKILNL